MTAGLGRSTKPSTASKRADVSGSEPASFRYNNPGAQYPSEAAAKFGQLGYGIIGGNHKIARFLSPVNGAAANFDLLFRNYTGMPIGEAGKKWTGANGFGVPGYNPSSILTTHMLEEPAAAIDLLKAIASRESGRGNNLTEEQWRQAHRMFKAGSADVYLDGVAQANGALIGTLVQVGAKTGEGLLKRALEHIGEEYRNILIPKDDPNWRGPWDCAEFMTWLVFQEAGILYGCTDNQAVPSRAEAYTGAWKTDVERLGKRVSVEEAASTVGGILLRYPPGPGKMGHIALCDGKGGTVEAKGRRYGVIADVVRGREWDVGVLVPGITYNAGSSIKVVGPEIIYKVNAPNMDRDVVTRIQQALFSKGFDPNGIDGDFGTDTQAAVIAFQEAEGMVVDGHVGPETAAALGISLTAAQITTPAVIVDAQGGGVIGGTGQTIGTGQATGVGQGGAAGPVAGAGQTTAGAATEPGITYDSPLLAALIMLLSRENPMIDGAVTQSPAGGMLKLLLPLLLQSALTGTRIDAMQLINILLTGKPAAPVVQNPVPVPIVQPTPAAQQPVDILTLLLPLLYQRMTGEALPGTTISGTTILGTTTAVDKPAEKPADKPQANQPVISKPSVQLSAGALAISTVLQALGIVGTPFGMGPDPTQTGTLATLIPIATAAIGATGGFGAILNAVGALFRGLPMAQKPK